MAVLRQTNNPDSGGSNPGNPGLLSFFKEGSAASTGWQVDSEGNITTAGTVTATGGVVSNGPATYTGATAETVVLSATVTGDVDPPRYQMSADGSMSWGPGNNPLDCTLSRLSGGVMKMTEFSFRAVRTSASGTAFTTQVVGDTANRIQIEADGEIRWSAGSGSTDTNLYRAAADILATDDDFAISTVGKGLKVREGTNAKMGVTAAMTAGTIVVSTTAVTANSRIFLTAQTTGAGPGALRVSARTAGTSFTITSDNAADTSTVAWMLVEPA